MRIRAWVDGGLLFVARDREIDIEHKVEIRPGIYANAKGIQPEHAVEVNGNIVWLPHPQGANVQPLLDLEKAQINMGREWPPRPETRVSL